MQISVKSDVAKALKSMSRLHKKQVPFAAALGLTMTAKKVAKVEQRMMVRKLDRPTPFTIKGVRWQGANKKDFATGRLHSRVYLMDKQAEYLRFQIEGGTRTPKGTAIAVPTSNVKLNRYGNSLVVRDASNGCWPRRTFSKAPSVVLPVFCNVPSVASAVAVVVA